MDVAFERRFARIPMEPDEAILRDFLKRNGMDAALSARVIVFFNWVRQNRNPYARIGHAYFYGVRDEVDSDACGHTSCGSSLKRRSGKIPKEW